MFHPCINLIVGYPIEHSLSPLMHNQAYRDLGWGEKFVYTSAEVVSEDLARVVEAVRVLGLNSLVCTVPHKVQILPFVDELQSITEMIGAANTVLNRGSRLVGYNTDWLGVLIPLYQVLYPYSREFLSWDVLSVGNIPKFLEGKKVSLLGAGGAARAMAVGVLAAGAELRIFNRTVSKAEELSQNLCVHFPQARIESYAMSEVQLVQESEVVLNSTSVGMSPNMDTLVPEKFLRAEQIVFDAVYKPLETPLLGAARNQGAEVINGLEMLLWQGIFQFILQTGVSAERLPQIEKSFREVL
jgi:shikimate dehydrogenase